MSRPKHAFEYTRSLSPTNTRMRYGSSPKTSTIVNVIVNVLTDSAFHA